MLKPLLIFCVSIFILLYFYLRGKVSYWRRQKIYQFPTSIFFGNALPLLWDRQKISDFFKKLYEDLKSKQITAGGLYIFHKPHLLITDPVHVKYILDQDFDCFTSRGTWYNPEIDPMSGNIFGFPYQKWKPRQAKISSLFASQSLKMIYTALEKYSGSVVKIVEEGSRNNKPVDMKDILWKHTATLLFDTAFGVKNFSNDPNILLSFGKDIFHPQYSETLKKYCYFLLPNILKAFKMSATSKRVEKFFRNLVDDTIDDRQKSNIRRNDLMQLMIENADLSKEEITAECCMFFSEGFETTATMLEFCLYELCLNKSVQSDIREEMDLVLRKYGKKLNYEALMELKQIDNVLKETLRKYPPVPFLIRKCTKDFAIPATAINLHKGDSVIISSYGMHKDPKNYSDPERFDPDRFSDKEPAINPYVYLPFGEGPRRCIGLHYAMLQGKFVLAQLIHNFKFSINGKTKLPISMTKDTFVPSIKGGLWLNAEQIKY